ncbi:hypothetical protein DFR72_1011208 [Lentzea flaviverrucosa]|uniref:Uncharacterized protein n=1 Tax=Lentzea flaviverrucosa TaxID=200379 RepID=A0A1H9EMM0_9PSEU|nr:hypothetical protein DFR72_1011208 [Lentzea flaviverrucosa]SEQ26258.1 hypothetical protein SAMN05216195_1029 [Lentzea flaviverrucosa]
MQTPPNAESVAVHHTCQPFLGDVVDDPRFPAAFQRDPWCWTSQLGYHRASAPSVPVELTLAHDRHVVVNADAVRIDQAMSLGLGWGTCNAPAALDDFLRGFHELADHIDFPTAEPFTRLGHAAREYSRRTDHADRVRAQQHVLSSAWQAARISVLSPWAEIMERVQTGEPLDARTRPLLIELGARGWLERFESDEAMRNHNLRSLALAMDGDTCVQGTRCLVALYLTTRHSAEQAGAWLDHVAHALRTIPS